MDWRRRRCIQYGIEEVGQHQRNTREREIDWTEESKRPKRMEEEKNKRILRKKLGRSSSSSSAWLVMAAGDPSTGTHTPIS